jgi:GT2 family glycosyltransferase
VAVGIVTRNRAHILTKAIASARAQTYPHLRVAVLDDGSTDGTPALCAQFPDVYWTRHDSPAGLIESRNQLMDAAAEEFYVSLDDDAWFLQGDEIAVAVSRMDTNPRLAAIAFDILSPDRPAPAGRGAPRPAAIFIGCGHLLRLAAVRQAGFYAACPGAYGSEEKDLCLRLADIGLSIELLPGVHVWHEKAWADRDNRPLHRSGVCNELVMTLRRCPLPDVLVVLPGKLVSYLLFWLHNPFYFSAGLGGVAGFIRLLPSVWRSRRPVQRTTFWRFHRKAP